MRSTQGPESSSAEESVEFLDGAVGAVLVNIPEHVSADIGSAELELERRENVQQDDLGTETGLASDLA